MTAQIDLAGRVIVVTGAGQGLGESTAHVCAGLGASVVVLDVDGAAAKRVADAIGDAALAVEADVAGCVVFGQYRIIEIELADHFNVSRTVVRDVLTRLRERGLVRKNQSSHWIAGPLTAQMIKDHYGLRGMLEPQALVAGAGRVDRERLNDLFLRLSDLERREAADHLAAQETIHADFIDICILATPNERLKESIRNNLLPVTATERLLRRLGLPGDLAIITELRLIVELLLRGAVKAAAAMMETHLEASVNRTIAQMKIVAIIPGPGVTAAYLTRVLE